MSVKSFSVGDRVKLNVPTILGWIGTGVVIDIYND